MKVMEHSLQQAARQEELAPKLVDLEAPVEAPVYDMTDIRETEEPAIIHWDLQDEEDIPVTGKILSISTSTDTRINTVDNLKSAEINESINSDLQREKAAVTTVKQTDAELIYSIKDSTSTTPVSAASGGYLARPSNIYAESKTEVVASTTSAEEPSNPVLPAVHEQDELLELQMQLVEREEIPAADVPIAYQAQELLPPAEEDPILSDESEEQQKRAAERLHKLRNLSFNVNAADPNNEFETVPAYIRRNMELYSNNTNVENFYSNYEVKKDSSNQTQISTINKFLDGKNAD
jgi:cell division protein FtsZ